MIEEATNVVSPAAGPDTANLEPLIEATTVPPIMPDRRPAYKGAPDAKDMPRHSGNATRKTDKPAGRSYLSHTSL